MSLGEDNSHVNSLETIVSQLKISLLGGFGINCGGHSITEIKTLRLQALMAYLLLHRAAPISRQQLAFQFWPESSERQARTNLRHLVHDLRSALPRGDNFLLGDGQEIAWNCQTAFSVDVDEFERSLDAAGSAPALRGALDLYRGDLLPACYDEWILPQRERLLQKYLAGLERLAVALEQASDYTQSIQVVQRLLQRDPVNEGAYQHLMTLHLADGDRAGALHTYQTYTTIFQRELGLEPSPAMQQAYEKLIGLKPSEAAEPRPGALRLVGREGEWQQLLAAWRAAAGGKPCLVLLEGEAGIGKTRLAEELLAWVERQGQRVALARSYQAETSLAYAPVTTWLRAGPLPALEPLWLSEVARLLPEILIDHPTLPHPAPLTEPWQRQRLQDSLARAILYGKQPALLVLDDIQWCEADTLEWLNFLLRYDPHARLMVLATLCNDKLDASHPLGTLLAGLRRSRQLVEIVLGPLDEPQGVELAAQAAGGELAVGQAQAIYSEAEGNPLFIVELTQAALNPPAPGLESPALPAGIQAVITSRLEWLSPASYQVAELAAVIGRQFSFQALMEATDVDDKTLVSSLDELWLQRIIREQGANSYDFSHEKIRQAIYDKLSNTRRRWLHRQIAEALERLQASQPNAPNGEIAGHYDRAGLVDKALAGYQAAAQAALGIYAHQAALDWLQRARALIPQLYDEALRRQMTLAISETLGDVLKTLGQRPEAIQAYQQALDVLAETERLERARLTRKLGGAWVEDRRYDAAWSCFTQAQAILESSPQEQDLGWQREELQVRLAQIHWHYWAYQWEQMAEIATEIQARMQEFGAPLQQVEYYHLLARRAFLQAGILGSQESRAAARQALQAARQAGDINAILTTQFSYGFQLLWSGELEPASQELSQALASAQSAGNLLLQTQCLTYQTILERRRGNLEQVAVLAQESLEAAQACQRADYTGVAQANQAWLAWRQGDLETADSLGQAAFETWNVGSHAYPVQWVGLWPMIAVRLAQGEVEQAVQLARRLLDPAQQRLPGELAKILEDVNRASTRGEAEAVRGLLEHALTLAQAQDYL
jgi:DNA-binding SARP family transcriptional activator